MPNVDEVIQSRELLCKADDVKGELEVLYVPEGDILISFRSLNVWG